MEYLDKFNSLTEQYGNPYSQTDFPKSKSIKDILAEFKPDAEIVMAGRLITKRGHGKSAFAHVSDVTGKMQIYAQLDNLGDKYEVFKKLDVGDIIGVKGPAFVTKTGEKTVMVKELVLLAKCFHGLPEKWHGLKDAEVKYRQRYLDLISSQETREVFMQRSKIITQIRDFFGKRDYFEVETPMLQHIPGGANGRPFKTFYNALDTDVYMRIAPELYLKRLLVGGFDRVYEINRSFRNEGVSTRHSPEFTMLEAYATYENFEYMMKICEDLISGLVKDARGSFSVEYQGKPLDFTPPWPRLSLAKLFEEELGIKAFDSEDEVYKKISDRFGAKTQGMSRSQLMNITEELVEKRYPTDKPVFIVDFFKWMSPLSKQSKQDPNIVDRFELFIAGFEVANSYSELNDPIEQEKRFKAKLKTEEELPKKIDEDFLTALQYGMPPAAGLGIGIDRLVMLIMDQPSIRDVILFPMLKPV